MLIVMSDVIRKGFTQRLHNFTTKQTYCTCTVHPFRAVLAKNPQNILRDSFQQQLLFNYCSLHCKSVYVRQVREPNPNDVKSLLPFIIKGIFEKHRHPTNVTRLSAMCSYSVVEIRNTLSSTSSILSVIGKRNTPACDWSVSLFNTDISFIRVKGYFCRLQTKYPRSLLAVIGVLKNTKWLSCVLHIASSHSFCIFFVVNYDAW
jgi:hypothetical protein